MKGALLISNLMMGWRLCMLVYVSFISDSFLVRFMAIIWR